MTETASPAESRIPRRLRFALTHFKLDEIKVLDLGCGPGTYLQHLGPGSVGLDMNPAKARAAGLDAREWNFVEGIPAELHGEFDAIWCSNLLEHVLSPHHFLIQIRRALKPGGFVVVVVPHTNRLQRGPWRGFLAADHTNFFTPTTLRHTLRFAGYSVGYLGSPSVPEAPPVLGRVVAPVSPVLMATATPITGFQYPEKAHKRLVDGEIEWKD